MNDTGIQSPYPFISGLLNPPGSTRARVDNPLVIKRQGPGDPRTEQMMSGLPNNAWNATIAPGGGISAVNQSPALFGMNPTILRRMPPTGGILNSPWSALG